MPLAITLAVLAAIPFVRYLWFYIINDPGNHVQSLLVGSILFTAAFISFTLGIIADLIRINRTLIEESLEQQKRARFAK